MFWTDFVSNEVKLLKRKESAWLSFEALQLKAG